MRLQRASGNRGFPIMPNLQSALGVFAITRARLAHQREPPRGAVAAGGDRARRHLRARAADAQSAAEPRSRSIAINDAVEAIAAATRAGTSFVFGYVGGGAAAVRRSRRRARDFILGVPGAAGRAGDERAVLAAVLLAHHAADRARLFLGAGAHARRRRRGRAVDRRQYLSSARSRRRCSSGPIWRN